jgi:hypothetical protein
VIAQEVRAHVVGAGIFVVAAQHVSGAGADLFVPATVGDGAILIRAASGVVGRVDAGAGRAVVVGAGDAVVAVRFAAALAACAVATLLGYVALGRAFAGSVGPALVDGARIFVVAIFRSLTGFARARARARIAGDAAVGCAGATAATRREVRATAGVRRERAQDEQEADTEPVAETASFHALRFARSEASSLAARLTPLAASTTQPNLDSFSAVSHATAVRRRRCARFSHRVSVANTHLRAQNARAECPALT